MANQKYVFLKALILTLIVFNLGVFMGYMLEVSRNNKIDEWYLDAETNILDQRVQKDALDLMDLDCELLIQENINFADRIFQEAQKIEKIEKATRISSDIVDYHRRYDILRTLFWMNSIRIKEKCNADYHNVVYFYQYNDPSIDQKSKQRMFSRLLGELKYKYGSDMMLIPIAIDNNISSINLLVNKFNLTEFPVILIDEKINITEVKTLEDIEKYLK